jgi:hypothetical protein
LEKYGVLAQNLKGLAFNFTDKRLFTVKMGQKIIFHLCEPHIFAPLDITILYTIFLGFEKYRVSSQQAKGLVSLHLFLQMSVHNENGLKICISSM